MAIISNNINNRRIFVKKTLIFLLGFMLIGNISFAGTKTLTFFWEQKITDDFAGWEFFHTTDDTIPLNQ
jgi:hypothetical protein